MTPPAPQADILAAVLVELRLIRSMLEHRKTRPIRAEDERLIVAVAAAVRDTVFTAGEVTRHAQIEEMLHDALDAAGITSPKQLGKAFRRLAGHVVEGMKLVRLGDDRSGALWRVSRG